jgi:hypothetical protein
MRLSIRVFWRLLTNLFRNQDETESALNDALASQDGNAVHIHY